MTHDSSEHASAAPDSSAARDETAAAIRRARASTAGSRAERLLLALGADPDFLDGVFGDIAEEEADRARHDGAPAAAAWRTRELLRSMPHLVRSALRHGGPRAYMRLAAVAAVAVLSISLVAVAFLLRHGAPVRLDPGIGNTLDGVIINNQRPVQLPIRVLDKRGNLLDTDSVHFTFASGMPVTILPNGVITCHARGDTRVRATLGAISTILDVRCRPVDDLTAINFINFIEGDTAARPLPFVATGRDGYPVMQLRGSLRVFDDKVAEVRGATIRAKGAGQTPVIVQIGEREARMMAVVHAIVPSFDSLRDNQRAVARPVRLAQGDTLRWALPGGSFWIKYLPRHQGDAPPTIRGEGDIGCMPGDGIHTYRIPPSEYGAYCIVPRGGTARVMVAHGEVGAEWVEGAVALQRLELR